MKIDHEKSLQLATRIYELDAKVYKSSGSELGRTLSGNRKRTIEDLAFLIERNPQGHILRSEFALIGNMARTIRDKDLRHEMMVEYNEIYEEIMAIPES